MGLKTDLIDAKIEGLKLSGATDEAILKAQDALDAQCELEKEAIVTFLENAKFRITNLAANVVLEDFKIPPQPADIQNTVTYVSPAGTPTPLTLPKSPTPSVLTKDINIGITNGGLQSSGYAYIGRDPNSKQTFGGDDGFMEEGDIKTFTEVRFFRDDNEGELG